jgi:3-oxoacyl-[acyl-carrier-protein] synthase-1
LISSTTTGGVREFEKFYYPLQDLNQTGEFEAYAGTTHPGEHTERLAAHFGIMGYVGTISTACSSSANALMLGARLIRHGELDTVICGGTEALSKFTLNGFNALMILDTGHCRPFDQSRKGLNLGEGAAYFVLQSATAMKRSGRTPLASLVGCGNANDAFHATASSADGQGAFLAMKQALEQAGIQSHEVSYINAHGTATENNDLSEGLAMQRIFGDQAPPFSSTKPFTGHTLAAAGAIEACYCLMAMQKSIIFPNLNFSEPMTELRLRPVTAVKHPVDVKYAMSNSFGFGGNTSSLLFQKA